MAASVTCTPSSPDLGDACRIAVLDADENTLTGYDDTKYPASPEVRYYLTFELGGDELGRSYEFSTDSDGGHLFNNYVFSATGSWTVRLSNVSDDSSVATVGVTVS